MMKQGMSFWVICAAGILALGAGARAASVEIALEAELATEIVAPLVVNVPKDVEPFGPKIDDPSRDNFIWSPGKPAEGGGGKGFARYVIDIPRADTYAIWGRVIAWDGNSDSFWVTVKPVDGDENPQESQDTHFRWAVQQGPNWHWDRINQWLDGGTFQREWKLPKGEAEIIIWTREDATMLDTLFVTTNLADTEAEVQPRVPTDKEVDQQMGGLAVSPRGRLALTWATVKSAP